ncbi:hypothetical protein JXA85_01040 [Candidatus Woesearchaeota archaeon]|nr:hypothetical protein [Candidatus Woesearchaeota archaeon]
MKPVANDAELASYLSVAKDFKLGCLDTEQQHPLSLQLSQQAKDDLYLALDNLKKIDVQALYRFKNKAGKLIQLAGAVNDTLQKGYKVYLCGCGATGRLSLSLETLCMEGMLPRAERDRIVGFMAGGDTALIRSIENFEDHPEYGARQLKELGYINGDLLISTTEGGETPFVIGATEYAAKVSSNKPWFLYCNPDEQLIENVERSRRVIENQNINKISLAVGPMAIAGSTRMQASTVLMAAVGLALMYKKSPESIHSQLNNFIDSVENFDFRFLKEFIEKEESIYRANEYLIYKTNSLGITVLTDTTERAPTFSLSPFENYRSPEQPASLCYLMMDGTDDARQAWEKLLYREPRCIEWDGIKSFAGLANLHGYDISGNIIALRKNRTGNDAEHLFEIVKNGDYMDFKFGELEHRISMEGKPLLFQHLLLKLMLNMHSTLVMGRMGRYDGNLMTYVKPSNYKLIDRCIRYVQTLYKQKTGKQVDYERVAEQVFRNKKELKAGEPIVMNVLNHLLDS